MGSEIMHVWTIGSSEDEDVINALPVRKKRYECCGVHFPRSVERGRQRCQFTVIKR